MKLLSHNMLKSCCKGVKTGYPLRILVIMMGATPPAWCINVGCMLLLLLLAASEGGSEDSQF